MRKLVWSDEFDYEGAPDPEKWTYQTGGHGWGNKEVQFYTDRTGKEDANAWVSGGKLSIELRREDCGGMNYTSARLNSRASWRYGRIEFSAKLPNGKGTWPAVWMLGENKKNVGWPACGEIDIMEHVARMQDNLHFSLHTALYNHKDRTHRTLVKEFPGVSEGFYVYAIDWKEDEIAFQFDGETVAAWRSGQDGTDTSSGGWPFNENFYLIMNLAYGGGFGGETDESALPQKLEIEYVRVYE